MSVLRLGRFALPLVASQLAVSLAATGAATGAARLAEECMEEDLTALLQVEIARQENADLPVGLLSHNEIGAAAEGRWGERDVPTMGRFFHKVMANAAKKDATAGVEKPEMPKSLSHFLHAVAKGTLVKGSAEEETGPVHVAEEKKMGDGAKELLALAAEHGQRQTPEKILQAVSHIKQHATEQEAKLRQLKDAVAEQETAKWVAALFSDEPAGEAIDGSNGEELVEKLTGYVVNEDGKAAGRAEPPSEEELLRAFFTDNRLEAMSHAMENDNAQASAELAARKAIAQTGGAVRDLRAGYHQKFDLLPEPGKPEEAGQKWHVELHHKQEGEGNRVSVLGHGLVQHFLKTE